MQAHDLNLCLINKTLNLDLRPQCSEIIDIRDLAAHASQLELNNTVFTLKEY